MAFVNALNDGITVAHYELMVPLKFKTERSCKEFIEDNDIPYAPVNGVWWVALEDVRSAMRAMAMTHVDRRADRKQRRDGAEA